MEELKDTFTCYDKTGTDQIDPADLETFLFAAGLNPVRSDVEKVLNEIGKNPITFETACAYYNSLASKGDEVSKAHFIEIFKPFDREANGHISVAEFIKITSQLGDKLTDDEISLVLPNFEVAANGTIAYQDIVNWAIEK
ncbi:Calmodulin [Thelohanellus kitauei]|uniref:Calmodulin n=1 Tax=Thelohanellus kitauei TaxID=669202 RepID=A0A0C2IX70_THEKT|nr:Calmodulin [Thelohanellus kitauei]